MTQQQASRGDQDTRKGEMMSIQSETVEHKSMSEFVEK